MARQYVFMFCLFLYTQTALTALDPDINSDSIVNWQDGQLLASYWNESNCNESNHWCQGADLDTDGGVGLSDLMIMADDWLFGDITYMLSRIPHVYIFANDQLRTTAQSLSFSQYPKHTISYASWYTTASSMWTSGFFPGCLWNLYEITGQTDYLDWATQWTEGLASQAATSNMDLGFMMMLSYEYGYRLTGNPEYPAILLQAAQSLASRYDPDVKCIRSWDWGTWQYPVIIDSMMSLDLLFWAANHGGSADLREIAMQHAYQVCKEHIRPDGGTYHVVDYNSQTGQVVGKMTWQGYSAESTWARGQAWGIYGFTDVYRQTGDPNMLNTAVLLADYYIDHLPSDAVPYWDFNAPDIPNAVRDSSAGAIAASALLELSSLVTDTSKREIYIRTAENTIVSLSTSVSQGGYLALNAFGQAASPSILMHACDHYPAGRIDMGLIYADYYYLESLKRYNAAVLNQYK